MIDRLMPEHARSNASGAVLVLVYVLTAAVTMQFSGHHVQPLFEGFAPPPPYRWVNPPPQFAPGNVIPKTSTAEFTFDAAGSVAMGATTDDGQFLVNVPSGGFPAHAGDSKLIMTMTPLDPAELGVTPPELFADGNAYHVEAAYRPSGEGITKLAVPGNLILTVPKASKEILYSADGKAWEELASQIIGNNTTSIGSSFTNTGYYLAVSAQPTGSPTTARKATRKDSNTGTYVIAGAVLIFVLALGVGPVLTRRLKGPIKVRRSKNGRKKRRR